MIVFFTLLFNLLLTILSSCLIDSRTPATVSLVSPVSFQASILQETPIITSQPFTLLAVGDIMLDRYVETLINKNGSNYPFEKLGTFLQQADITLGNLEGPVLEQRKQAPNHVMNFSFNPELMTNLRDQGFDIVSLANNHTYDHGKEGFEETQKHVTNANIIPLGNPVEIAEEFVVHQTINSNEVTFLGFNATTSKFDREKAIELVKTEHQKHPDFVIVTIHWGDEYALSPNKSQTELAHAFIDNGADTVIGHHPHVVQSIERYQGKVIFYSLGNFIFDQYFSTATQELLAISAQFSNDQITYKLIPLKSIRSQPQEMDEENKKKFLKSLADRSSVELAPAIENASMVSNN